MEFDSFRLHYNWNERDVWGLPGEYQIIPVQDLEAHMDYPFLDLRNRPYAITPSEVLNHPHSYPTHYARMMAAEEDYAVNVVRHPVHGKWIILDGLHRLMKAVFFGRRAVKCWVVSWDDFVGIAIEEAQ